MPGAEDVGSVRKFDSQSGFAVGEVDFHSGSVGSKLDAEERRPRLQSISTMNCPVSRRLRQCRGIAGRQAMFRRRIRNGSTAALRVKFADLAVLTLAT